VFFFMVVLLVGVQSRPPAGGTPPEPQARDGQPLAEAMHGVAAK